MDLKFRAIEETDLELLQSWRNDCNVLPFVREYRYLSKLDQREWFESYRKARRTSDWDQELMIVERDTFPVGVAGFVRIQWRNRRAEISYYTPEVKQLYEVEQTIKELLRKGFHDFGLHKIVWPVYGHHPHLNLIKSIMREEAVLRDEYQWNGRLYDRHYMVMTRSEFDKLN